MTILVRNGTIVTMNDQLEILEGGVLIRDGEIVSVGATDESADRVIDARGGYILPGFVQTHVHLCQTLFRSFADDLPLLAWLGAVSGRSKPRTRHRHFALRRAWPPRSCSSRAPRRR